MLINDAKQKLDGSIKKKKVMMKTYAGHPSPVAEENKVTKAIPR